MSRVTERWKSDFLRFFWRGRGVLIPIPTFRYLVKMNMMVDLAIAETDSKPERHLAGTDCLGSVHSAENMAH